jgi:hypothetical protein
MQKSSTKNWGATKMPTRHQTKKVVDRSAIRTNYSSARLDAKQWRQTVKRSATLEGERSRSDHRLSKPTKDDLFTSRLDSSGRVGMRRKVAASPSSLDADSRTVQAIIATDTPVRIYDWGSDEFVDELLVPRGMQATDQGVQLRDNHQSMETCNVVGSVGNLIATDSAIEATLEFSSAEDVQELFIRVSEGHLRGVSIGGAYTSKDYTQIAAGKTISIDGRKYTAKDVPLRVVTRWTLEEVSVVVRGADKNALVRSKDEQIRTQTKTSTRYKTSNTGASIQPSNRTPPKEQNMKLTRRAVAFLRKLGLDSNVTSQVVAFARGLNAEQQAELIAIDRRAAAIYESTDDDDIDDDVETETTRKKPTPVAPVAETVTRSQADLDAAKAEERQRIADIRREAGNDVPENIVERAINENWTVDQACRRFLQEVRRGSRPAIANGDTRERAPAGHVANGPTVEALQAAVLMRSGVNLQNEAFATERALTVFERNDLRWLYDFNRDMAADGKSEKEKFIDVGRKFKGDHPMRTCERVLAIRGKGSVPSDPSVILERAFGANSYMPRVFGAIISVGLVDGYMAFEDSTVGWTSEADWADFRDNQPIGLDVNSSLKLLNRGTTAREVEFSDFGEKYRVNRLAGKFTFDEQDIIDDIVGANQQTPRKLGELAAAIRPDLVYSVLMANAALASDGVALFHASRANLLTSNALSLTGMTAAETAMATQKIVDRAGNAKALNLVAGYLIVPRALRIGAKQITTSTTVVSGNTTAIGSNNAHAGAYQVRSDARLDLGVVDPRNDTFVAGSASKWYVAEMSGQMTIQVGYLRGTGRAPQLRMNRFNETGKWGYGWDVCMDIGVGVISPRGLLQSS